MIAHLQKEFLRHWETSGRADHRIDSAFWTERSLALINPFTDLDGRESGEAVETSTKRTTLYFGAVKTALFVRFDMRWVETAGIQANHNRVIECTARTTK